jgi:hypothetical protein
LKFEFCELPFTEWIPHLNRPCLYIKYIKSAGTVCKWAFVLCRKMAHVRVRMRGGGGVPGPGGGGPGQGGDRQDENEPGNDTL